MKDLQEAIDNLSPRKRQLFEQRLKERKCRPAAQTIPRRTVFSPAPLSYTQEGLWFLYELEPESPIYNIPAAVRIKGCLQVPLLEESLNAVVRRHEILRTTFSRYQGEAVQVIAESLTLQLPVVDLSGLAETERESRFQKLASEEVLRLFDLSRGPLLRGTLARLGEEEHILVLVMHHIASDGWSMGVLFKELAALYEALSAGKPDSLAPVPLQYADYAHWQRQSLQGTILEEQIGYWKNRLAGAPSMLELPVDRPRPSVQGFQGATQTTLLPAGLVNGLKELSRQQGVTLFMTLLAAFNVLLFRYTGREDVLVGTPTANRHRVELDSLIGFFVNTLVLRTDLSGDPAFTQLLGRVREVAVGAFSHQDLPFDKLVEALQPKRDLSHSPLFQVMFVLQNAPTPPQQLGSLAFSDVPLDGKTSMYDLTLSLTEGEEGLNASIEFNTDLFEASRIERMMTHFQILLESVVAAPDTRISALPLLSKAERHQLLVGWNSTFEDYPQDRCIHELIEQKAAETPDAVAVVFKGKQWTYRQLDRRASQLAVRLQAMGVGPEVPVGLCLRRSLDLAAGLLGILKSGGAYVPLDPDYPQDRLAYILEDSQISIIVSTRDLSPALPATTAKLICLDRMTDGDDTPPAEAVSRKADITNLAYIIYTSGSTGRPKGVQVVHRNLLNHNLFCVRAFGLRSDDRILQFSSINFDASVEEIFPIWLAGGTLVIRDDEVVSSFSAFLQLLEQEHITVLDFSTAYWHELVPYLKDRALPGSIRLVIFGGEQASPQRFAEWREYVDARIELINSYGPTETTIISSLYRYDPAKAIPPNGTLPIGAPIANTVIYILDKNMQLVPAGVAGEICIGGMGVTRGYLNQPGMTARSFIRNPFENPLAERIYRTGDLGRYLSDGNIEYCGRVDNQVKFRGYRIELGEVEAALGAHEDVSQAAALLREDTPGNKMLAGYIVTKGEREPAANELKDWLKARLPDYMIPSSFTYLARLPLTPNGKVDRKALPIPDNSGLGSQPESQTPRNETEALLAELWQQALGVKQISVTADFFDLGGHSLLAARLLAKIEDAFGRKMSLAALFKHPTIEAFAQRLQDESRCVPSEQVHAIQPKGSRMPLFVVTSQPPLYRSLAARLGTDQPLFGITSPEWTALPPDFTLQDIAANLLEALCDAQPQGPYYLAGWCMSGVIAYDMAQKLRARGQEVALLAIFDGLCPFYRRRFDGLRGIPASYYVLYRIWLLRLQKMSRMQPGELLRYVHKSLQPLAERQRETWKRLFSLAGRRTDAAAELLQFGDLEVDASRAYTPQPCDFPGVVFTSQATRNELGRYHDRHMGWKPFFPKGLETYEMPGSHEDMFYEPGVASLAEKLCRCLQAAKTAHSGKTPPAGR